MYPNGMKFTAESVRRTNRETLIFLMLQYAAILNMRGANA